MRYEIGDVSVDVTLRLPKLPNCNDHDFQHMPLQQAVVRTLQDLVPFSVGLSRIPQAPQAPEGQPGLRVLLVHDYQAAGGSEKISKTLVEAGGDRIRFSNATLMHITEKGSGARELFNHVTESDVNGQRRTTTEVVRYGPNSNFSSLQQEPGIVNWGRGPFGEAIETKVDRNYLLNLSRLSSDSKQKPGTEEQSLRFNNGVLNQLQEGGYEINPAAIEAMKTTIADADPQVVYVTQDYAVATVVKAVAEVNASRPEGQKIGVVWGIHRDNMTRDNTQSVGRNFIVDQLMKATREDDIDVVLTSSASTHRNYLDNEGNGSIARMVENGTDCATFQRNEELRARFREANGIPASAKVVTLAARFVKDKDIAGYVKVMASVLRSETDHDVHFVACGAAMSVDPDSADFNRKLSDLLKQELGNDFEEVEGRIHFIGFQPMHEVFSGSDVVLSTSRAESWGLTLLEGAAAGCVSVYPDLPGTRQAMGGLTGKYGLAVARKESDARDPLFKEVKALSNESVAAFAERTRQALDLSEQVDVRQDHVSRAKETDVSKMVDGYFGAFDEAYRKANGQKA